MPLLHTMNCILLCFMFIIDKHPRCCGGAIKHWFVNWGLIYRWCESFCVPLSSQWHVGGINTSLSARRCLTFLVTTCSDQEISESRSVPKTPLCTAKNFCTKSMQGIQPLIKWLNLGLEEVIACLGTFLGSRILLKIPAAELLLWSNQLTRNSWKCIPLMGPQVDSTTAPRPSFDTRKLFLLFHSRSCGQLL